MPVPPNRSLALLTLCACTACTVRHFQFYDSEDRKTDTTSPIDDSDPTEPIDDSDPTTDDSGPTDTDTTDHTTTTGPIDYDCDEIPPFNLGDQTLDDARAYHGVAFDDGGHLIGWDGRSALFKSSYDGTRTQWVPNLRSVEQLDRWTDGNIILVDGMERRIARVGEDGGLDTLVPNVSGAYGLITGPDGKVYVADGQLRRIDPTTGENEVIVQAGRRWSIHSFNFNLDSTRIYLGTIGSGDVYYVDLDDDLEVISEPTLFASGVGTGWHDGVGVDACGYVYVADYQQSGLYRISPDGSTVVRMVAPGNFTLYGHGLEWGRGIGGWRADALYQPQPYNNAHVREVIVGIPSGDTVRTWKGKPVPW